MRLLNNQNYNSTIIRRGFCDIIYFQQLRSQMPEQILQNDCQCVCVLTYSLALFSYVLTGGPVSSTCVVSFATTVLVKFLLVIEFSMYLKFLRILLFYHSVWVYVATLTISRILKTALPQWSNILFLKLLLTYSILWTAMFDDWYTKAKGCSLSIRHYSQPFSLALNLQTFLSRTTIVIYCGNASAVMAFPF